MLDSLPLSSLSLYVFNWFNLEDLIIGKRLFSFLLNCFFQFILLKYVLKNYWWWDVFYYDKIQNILTNGIVIINESMLTG